ncbi:MAG: OmpA family protein [Planctomycetota bacterium]
MKHWNGLTWIGGFGGGRRTAAALVAAVGGAASLMGGCVSQTAYDDLLGENRTLTSRNVELQGRVRELEQLNTGLQQNTSGTRAAFSDLERTNAMLRQQVNQSRATILDLEDRLDGLALREIDPATDLALTRLAARFPNLLQYDPDRGLIRLSSDVTFDSGSAQVKDGAAESLAALAEVLNAPEATGYDIRIVGHTDSAKPSAATQRRHPTNMHLSVHRAIAVRARLASLGIESDRMYPAGWGEFRPAVPNNPGGNTPENRRVEIFLSGATDRPVDSGGGADAEPAAGGGGEVRPTRPSTDPVK